MKKKIIVGLLLFLRFQDGFTQTSSFQIPASLCLEQTVKPVNNSVGATSYIWDLCNDGLTNPSSGSLAATANISSSPEGVELANDGGNWFGFYFERDNNHLLRLSFGNNLSNTPTATDLGNVGSLFNLPVRIRLVKENGLWYAVVCNFIDNKLIRLNFGTTLANSPAATDLNVTGLSNPRGLWIDQSSGTSIVMVASWGSANQSFFRFGNGLGNTFTDMRSISTISQGLGCALYNDAGTWYAFVASFSGTLLQINLGSSLFTNPVDPVQTVVQSGSQWSDIALLKDGLNYFLWAESFGSSISFFQFGNSLSLAKPPTVSAITNLAGVTGNTSQWAGVSIVRSGTAWSGLFLSQNSGSIFQIQFTDQCANQPIAYNTSTLFEPTGVLFTQPGSFAVDLIAYNATGGFDISTHTTTVSALTALPIGFSTTDACFGSSTAFTAFSTPAEALTNVSWDWGDNTPLSTGQTATHNYSTPGSKTVFLSATASNGCSNLTSSSVGIYNPPTVNFNLPTSSPSNPLCTNNAFTFINVSNSDAGSTPIWSWSVNGVIQSSAADLVYSAPDRLVKNIQLSAVVGGCAPVVLSKNFQANADGPSVSFTTTGQCVNTPVSFTNNTAGSVSSYSWMFGDGNTSTQMNSSNTYTNTGPYSATLTATNATTGCQNSFSKNISIYTNPQPDFSIEAPPFSCANYPAQFDNNTIPLTDSNITSWQWNFGDTNNGSSSQKNPAYIYSSDGSYSVSLKATTNYGCTAIKTTSITISPSPQAGFTNSVACLNQDTPFTSTSTGNIASYSWTFPGQVKPITGTTSPSFTFTSTGDNTVKLSVASTNGCISVFEKNINVPVPPAVDFSVQNPCTGKPTVLQEVNSGGADPTVSWNWNFGSASSSGSPVNYQFPASGGYLVTLNTTHQSGCVYSVTKAVSIYDGPIASFTPSTYAGDAPLYVKFDNTSVAYTYLWQFGDAAHSTRTLISPDFTYSTYGQYKVLLTAYNQIGCFDTLSAWISVVVPKPNATLKVFSLAPGATTSKPVVSILNSGNVPLVNPDVYIDLGNGAVIKETVIGVAQPNQAISATLDLQIVPNTAPYVCAQVVVPNDVNPSTGKACISLEGDVVLEPYPNPASGSIHFNWITANTENAQIMLFKADGVVAFQQNVQNQSAGLIQFSIPVSSLANGIYLLRYTNSSIQKTFRVVVAN